MLTGENYFCIMIVVPDILLNTYLDTINIYLAAYIEIPKRIVSPINVFDEYYNLILSKDNSNNSTNVDLNCADIDKENIPVGGYEPINLDSVGDGIDWKLMRGGIITN
jgi:hypothetical protein